MVKKRRIVKNRYNVQQVLAKEPELAINNISSEESEIESNESDEIMNFNIVLTTDEWKDIGPKITKYNCQDNKFLKTNKKNYHVLEPYQWTNVIHKHFHAHCGIPCAISYKRAKVHPGGNIYLKIVGNCSSCDSRFTGEIENEPSENALIVISYTPNDQNNVDILELNECETDSDINILTSDPEYFKIIKVLYNNCVDLSKIHDHGDRDNHQHNIKISKRLLQFCKLLPCWTAVMVPFFGFDNITQTSASSESQFNDLKNRVFKHTTLPLRIDRFLTTHINSFTDENDQMQFYDNEQTEALDENVSTINVDENKLIQTEENLSQQQYLHNDENQPLQTLNTENVNICMVCINGHKPTGAHICDLCKKAVHIIDGCSYSILEEEEGFGEKWICHQYGINVQTYRKRSMILKKICSLKELPEQLICIQADTTIEVMARNLLENWPSRVDTQHCISCPRQQINQQPIFL
ncbi:hypothetical protein ACI65C_004852 [Semiaphis heraclei]